jgi:site-specific DNA-methyltransferase (cytosine-N4-specific)
MTKINLNKKEILDAILNAKNTVYLNHNMHPYPAKFIPQIPNTMIKLFTKPGDTVLDPYCGSGTSLVEARILGRHAIGIDLHPIAVLMSKVKTTKINEKELDRIPKLLSNIEKRIDEFYNFYLRKTTLYSFVKKQINYMGKFSFEIPEIPNIDHWFQKHVQYELAIIKNSINKSHLDSELKNFLLLVFSSIVVHVSNQDSETRYVAKNKKIEFKHTFKLFKEKLEHSLVRLKQFNEVASNCKINVIQKDARFLDFLKENSVDFIITSPPYPNTYDYYLYHKFRIFWLGYNFGEVRDNEIGSRNRHSSKKEGIDSYINDMIKCFENFHRILKPNKYFVIVVGDSIINGKLCKGDEIIKEIAQKSGFKFIDKVGYNLSLASKSFNPAFRNKNKEEHIIFLRNEK